MESQNLYNPLIEYDVTMISYDIQSGILCGTTPPLDPTSMLRLGLDDDRWRTMEANKSYEPMNTWQYMAICDKTRCFHSGPFKFKGLNSEHGEVAQTRYF